MIVVIPVMDKRWKAWSGMKNTSCVQQTRRLGSEEDEWNTIINTNHLWGLHPTLR